MCGAVLLVMMMELRWLVHHCMNRSREKPHSMSGTLARTALRGKEGERERERERERGGEREGEIDR